MLHPETLQFYHDLRLNNNRDWFQQNRNRYDAAKADYLALAEKVLSPMKLVDSSLSNLLPKNCVFRINRDIRFSPDKSPYKTHLGVVLSGDRNMSERAGFYLHIDEAGCFLAGGIYMPQSEALKKLRREIADYHEDLTTIFNHKDFKSRFAGFDREENIVLKRPPQGFTADDKAIEYLKFKSYTVSKPFDISLVTNSKGIDFVVEHFTHLKPLNDFLNRAFH
jgi:uncharacterized protein (TIGR02453 family)